VRLPQGAPIQPFGYRRREEYRHLARPANFLSVKDMTDWCEWSLGWHEGRGVNRKVVKLLQQIEVVIANGARWDRQDEPKAICQVQPVHGQFQVAFIRLIRHDAMSNAFDVSLAWFHSSRIRLTALYAEFLSFFRNCRSECLFGVRETALRKLRYTIDIVTADDIVDI
jgi:hypothetical protein